MKRLLVIAILATCSIANAQKGCDILNPSDSAKYAQVWQLSIPELKEFAKQSYFRVIDMVNNKISYTKEEFEKALNQYEYWRTVVHLKLHNKKDNDEFNNWIFAEARAAGKLTYEAKKS